MEKAAKEGRLKVVGDVLSRKKTLTKKNINLSKNDQGVLSGGFTNSRSGATTCGASMMSLESSIGALSAIRVGHTIGMPVFEAQQNATLFVGDSSRFKFQTVDSDGDAIDWGLFADVPQWLMDEYDANLAAGNSTPCDKLLVLLLRICGATGPAAGACVAAAITLYLACIAR